MTLKMTPSELDKIYRSSKEVDYALFAEMRSNLLLIAGEHYQKKGSQFWERLRDSKAINESQKLRLVKNHTKKLVKGIKKIILSHAPNTSVVPVNESEIQDQKAAQLNKSVLDFYKKRLGMRSLIRDFADDFVGIGEVAAKVFWDNDIGDFKGYALVTDENGQPLVSIKTGEQKKEAIMSGDPVIERIFGFNLLRDPEVQDMEKSPYLIVVKLVHQDVVRRMAGDNEDIVKSLDKTKEEEFLVFDATKGTFSKEKEHTVIREHFYRPTKDYPNGYYYIAIQDHVLSEGELPAGLWPIVYKRFDKVQTYARGKSPVRDIRPYQIEINRSSSSTATAQITLGDPKLILRNGSKMTAAGQLPGVRAINVTGGQDPQILPGASGDNFIPYTKDQISELYTLMDQDEVEAFNNGTLDPYALLFYSMRNKEKFSDAGESFEEFIVSTHELLLNIIKHHMPDDMLVPIIGKSELVNIQEFKSTTPNKYRIKVEAVSDDMNTMLGKQLAINHCLQYVGPNLDKQDIGRLIRAMPFLNAEEAYGDLTLDYDNVKNDFLALERGEIPLVNIYDNHDYIINRVVNRMKQADFRFLGPQIQQAFEQYKQQHEQMATERIMSIQRAQSGMIPTGGYLAKCDLYMNTPDGKTQRVEIPAQAIEWLIEQLDAQGQPLALLQNLSNDTLNQLGAANPNNGINAPQNTGARNG